MPQTSSMSRGPTPAPMQAAPADRVRRGHEWIGAVVEVEHGALGPLEEDSAVGVECLPAELCGVGDVRLEAVPVGEIGLDHRVQVELRILGEGPEHLLLRLHARP